MTQKHNQPGAACNPSKWFAHINDTRIPAAQRSVLVRVLKTQASVPDGHVLVRDHNSPNDVALEDDQTIDLGEGNVLYTVPKCDLQPRGHCAESAKLAFSVDDRVEITTRPDQTGKGLRDWFGIAADRDLFRDHESAVDESIEDGASVMFSKGPVLVTREAKDKGLKIIVNNKPFTKADGVKTPMTGLEIAALVSPAPDKTDVYRLEKGERVAVALTASVTIENCLEFVVVRQSVQGGFQPARIDVELGLLREHGAAVTFVEGANAAVVYHQLPTRPGFALPDADVLVPVPSGYPGAALDWAYLEEGSPLLGHVPGAQQGGRIAALGKTWVQVSYHPHNGGGAPPWNKDRHGFHTYLDEILAWLNQAR